MGNQQNQKILSFKEDLQQKMKFFAEVPTDNMKMGDLMGENSEDEAEEFDPKKFFKNYKENEHQPDTLESEIRKDEDSSSSENENDSKDQEDQGGDKDDELDKFTLEVKTDPTMHRDTHIEYMKYQKDAIGIFKEAYLQHKQIRLKEIESNDKLTRDQKNLLKKHFLQQNTKEEMFEVYEEVIDKNIKYLEDQYKKEKEVPLKQKVYNMENLKEIHDDRETEMNKEFTKNGLSQEEIQKMENYLIQELHKKKKELQTNKIENSKNIEKLNCSDQKNQSDSEEYDESSLDENEKIKFTLEDQTELDNLIEQYLEQELKKDNKSQEESDKLANEQNLAFYEDLNEYQQISVFL